MATVVPSRIPPSATTGEKKLHQILGNLPSDWVVYYEPNIEGRHPDFVVISPDLGILIIEDKYWQPGTIYSGDRKSIVLDLKDRGRTTVTHPEAQVRSYMFRLKEIASSVRYGRHFLHQCGPFEGRLRIPIATIVSLSNITSNQFYDRKRGIEPIFDSETTILRDDLDRWITQTAEELETKFCRFFKKLWSIPRLSTAEVKALRAIVHPEIDFENSFSAGDLLTAANVIDDQQQVVRVLDLRQEDVALSLGEGHRVLFGVAGSGKTVILIARARLLAKQNPDSTILLTCYNRELAEWITKQVSDCPQIVVSTFHKLCYDNGLRFSKERSDHEWGSELETCLRHGSRDSRRFDALLVDEAQDFEPSWFRCLLSMAKDPVDGDFLIVADGAQGLYRRSKLSWKQLGIRAQGRTHSKRFDLDRNYRNSSEILTLAETLTTKINAEAENDDDGIQSLRINTTACIRSTGALPVLFRRASWEAELVTAQHLVKRLTEGKWLHHQMPALRPEEIAILYPKANPKQKNALEALGVNLAGSLGHSEPSQVKIQTIYSAKGLQYRAVILIWTGVSNPFVDRAKFEEVERHNRRLLYVGMTRAESYLAITTSSHSQIVEELALSPACEVIDPPQSVLASAG